MTAMSGPKRLLLAVGCTALFQTSTAFATNPLIMDQFTADPTARVFEGKIYLYPSHDILPFGASSAPMPRKFQQVFTISS